jgi:curli biogenesis system outer membrane secretion channel CsgG
LPLQPGGTPFSGATLKGEHKKGHLKKAHTMRRDSFTSISADNNPSDPGELNSQKQRTSISKQAKSMTSKSSKLIGLLFALTTQLGFAPEGKSQTILDSFKSKPVTVAVRRVKNMAGSFAESGILDGRMVGFWRPSFETRLAEILSTELANTGHFTVLEREHLYDVLAEQNLPGINPATAAQKNNLNQARYIIIASLSDYVPNTSGTRKNTDSRVLIFGGGQDKTEVNTYVAFDLRVIDTSTGTIAYSRTIEGETSSVSKTKRSNFDVGLFEIKKENLTYDATSATRALRAAMISTVGYLDCMLYLQDECVETYRALDESRKADTLDSLNLF